MALIDRIDDLFDGLLDGGKPQGDVEVNKAGVGLAVAGAALMVIAMFLPQLDSPVGMIAENSFAQSGTWWFAGLAVVTVAATYRVVQQRQTSFSVLLIGVVAVGFAVYFGTGERLELINPVTDRETGVAASPGLGVYAGGIGGALVAYGGLLLVGWGIWPGGAQAPARRTKQCSDCAETVLADARVCKHCGYRF